MNPRNIGCVFACVFKSIQRIVDIAFLLGKLKEPKYIGSHLKNHVEHAPETANYLSNLAFALSDSQKTNYGERFEGKLER